MTLIEELTWSNLGLIKVFMKYKLYFINANDINILNKIFS